MLSEATNTPRLSGNRLKTTKAVEVRDAKPLNKLQQLIEDLCKRTDAAGGCIMLSAEEDVPLAVSGSMPVPVPMSHDDEKTILNGEAQPDYPHSIHPIFHHDHVVGYIALREADTNSGFYCDLVDAYSQLAGKELELADKTAKLQYQNEKITRKQKQLEQAINFNNNILSLTTHDLRSPLNAVKGYLELMETSLNADQNVHQLSDYHLQISKGIGNISDLVDQLNEIAMLELRRIELNLVKVDLNWVVQEVCDVMQGPALNKGQNLKLMRCEKPLHVEVDIPKAKRIIFNLLSNAIKYTRYDGDINVDLSEQKGTARVSIQDNGIGIPKSRINEIFEPFQKLQHKGTRGESSTGLGLFVSSYLTRLFKGSLTVESEENRGSMFYLNLPITKSRI